MANHGLIVGLDVGTNTVKVLAADVRDQQANIVAVGRAVSHGVKKGVVVDIDAAATDIRQAIAQVNEQAREPVTDVVALLPAKEINIAYISGTITVADSQHISYEDVRRVVQEALKSQASLEREVVDVLPVEFIVDDFDGIQDPHDMVGMRLTLRAVAYTAPRNLIMNTRLAVQKAGLQVRDFVLTPLAEGMATLSEAEQQFGSILLDFGAGQTTATIIKDHHIKMMATFPAGGDNITRDISSVLSIGEYDADMLKLDAGNALVDQVQSDQPIMIQRVGASEPEQISETYLAGIIEARVTQILTKIGQELDEAVGQIDIPGGIVTVGGTAALRGMTDAVERMYQVNARQFAPTEIGLHYPGLSGVWSAVQYAAKQTPIQLVVKQALYDLPLLVLGQQAPVMPNGAPSSAPVAEKPRREAPKAAAKQYQPREPRQVAADQPKVADQGQGFGKLRQVFGQFFGD